jgi:hypothetical protein
MKWKNSPLGCNNFLLMFEPQSPPQPFARFSQKNFYKYTFLSILDRHVHKVNLFHCCTFTDTLPPPLLTLLPTLLSSTRSVNYTVKGAFSKKYLPKRLAFLQNHETVIFKGVTFDLLSYLGIKLFCFLQERSSERKLSIHLWL